MCPAQAEADRRVAVEYLMCELLVCWRNCEHMCVRIVPISLAGLFLILPVG